MQALLDPTHNWVCGSVRLVFFFFLKFLWANLLTASFIILATTEFGRFRSSGRSAMFQSDLKTVKTYHVSQVEGQVRDLQLVVYSLMV